MTAEGLRDRVLSLRAEGCSYREIGRRAGISHEQARKLCRDAGLTALTVVPDGLARRGQAFWDHAVAEFELDQHEQELLVQVCRLLDRADQLKAEVDRFGLMLDSPSGLRRPNPAVAEERQVSLALGRLLGQLEVPAADEDETRPGIRSGFSTRARRAARRRWGPVEPAS